MFFQNVHYEQVCTTYVYYADALGLQYEISLVRINTEHIHTVVFEEVW